MPTSTTPHATESASATRNETRNETATASESELSAASASAGTDNTEVKTGGIAEPSTSRGAPNGSPPSPRQPAGTVAIASSPSVGWLRGVVFTALFGALFIAFSSLSVPLGFSPVPITLQTLAVMLAGGLLGAFYGFWSIAVVILLTATGLPLIHGNGGLAALYGPTSGFIWMFPFAALFIGWVSDRLFREHGRRLAPARLVALAVTLFVGGALLIYAGGVPWLAYKANLSFAKAMSLGCYPFLLGDSIKTVVAALLIGALRPFVPPLRPASRKRPAK